MSDANTENANSMVKGNTLLRILPTEEIYPIDMFRGFFITCTMNRSLELVVPQSSETPIFGVKLHDELILNFWVKLLKDPFFNEESGCDTRLGRTVHSHILVSDPETIGDIMETEFWAELDEVTRQYIVGKMHNITKNMARLESSGSPIVEDPNKLNDEKLLALVNENANRLSKIQTKLKEASDTSLLTDTSLRMLFGFLVSDLDKNKFTVTQVQAEIEVLRNSVIQFL